MSFLLKRQSLYSRIVSIMPTWAFRKTFEKPIHASKFAILSNNCWGAHVYQRMGIAIYDGLRGGIGVVRSKSGFARELASVRRSAAPQGVLTPCPA